MTKPRRRLRLAAICGLGLVLLHGHKFTALADQTSGLLPIWREILARPETSLASIPAPPANPITPAKVELGRMLFSDTRLSGENTRSCATCHENERAFTDGRRNAPSLDGKTQLLNAPTLFNLAWSQQLFHDGRSSSLEDQAGQPIEHPQEMAGSWPQIIRRLSADPTMVAGFHKAFPKNPAVTRTNILAAIATYERTLISPKSRFDHFIDGDDAALTPEEQAGFQLFVGKAGCISCHSGWRLSDGKLHNVGTVGANPPDGGAPHRLVKTPGLQGVSRTAPYMHNGSLPTLQRVIQHYLKLKEDGRALSPNLVRPLRLTEQEQNALKAFLMAIE
jgi:cytochrome c peroxidase